MQSNPLLTMESAKAKLALDSLIAQFEAGEISTESELLDKVNKTYVDLYTGVTEPFITPREIGTLVPRYSALRDPLVELEKDFELSREQLAKLKTGAEALVMQQTQEIKGLQELFTQATRQMVDLQAIDENAGTWKTDTFTSLVGIDTGLTTADVNTSSGIVTLRVESMLSIRDQIAGVTVDHVDVPAELPKTQSQASTRGSSEVDGLPGNPIEIETTTQAVSNITEVAQATIPEPTSLKYVGDSHPERANLVSLFDESNSTWFEWGAYVVPNNQYLKKQGSAYVACEPSQGKLMKVFGIDGVTEDLGWKFNIPWPGTTEVSERFIVSPWYLSDTPRCQLSMTMTIRFSSPLPLSWVEILPEIIKNSNVQLIAASASADGSTGWTDILKRRETLVLNDKLDQSITATDAGITSKDISGSAILQCSMPKVSAIKLHFVQDTAYEMLVGHRYALEQYDVSITANSRGVWDTHWYSAGKVSIRKGILTEYIATTNGRLDFTRNLPEHEYHSSRKVPHRWASDAEKREFGGYTFMKTEAANVLWSTGIASLYSFSEPEETANLYDIFKAYRYSIAIKNIGMYTRQYSKTGALTTKAHLFASPITAVTMTALDTVPEDWSADKQWITYQVSHDGNTWFDIQPNRTGTSPGTTVYFPAPTRSVRIRILIERPDDRPRETPVIEYYALQGLTQDLI